MHLSWDPDCVHWTIHDCCAEVRQAQGMWLGHGKHLLQAPEFQCGQVLGGGNPIKGAEVGDDAKSSQQWVGFACPGASKQLT